MIIDNIKNYFKAKLEGKATSEAPEGVCPNCWGKQEWDGKFYEKIKANNITPETNTYTSFIHEVVEKLDKITLKEDTYVCTSCNMKYPK
ncbi:MAG: hypothetical protein AB3N14_17610 [Flavobacteriaceae bacterium]